MAGGRDRNLELLLDLLLSLDAIALPVVSLLYPAIASFNAIKSKSIDSMCKWLTYWVAYAAICLFESILGGPFEWLPLWRYMKIIATGWLSMPWFDGVTQIHVNFIESFSAKGTAARFRENFNESVAGGRSAVAGLMGGTNRVEVRTPVRYDYARFHNHRQSKREVVPEHDPVPEEKGAGVNHHDGQSMETELAEPAVEPPGHNHKGQPKVSRMKRYVNDRREKCSGRKPPETSGHEDKSFISWESGNVIHEDALRYKLFTRSVSK